ncbi:alpha/beta-hydrolase [Fomitiporia mediterranea MF3/22]|uniref:alpha/beta-hydrolase n=1 Tax=Fomitiporia mediterranea (strain MF3/22) TaxID=694068 RepID=UPI00044088A9|nr:alpha/beta-hydrolase [Fomitiporia mediterranea MF3/22]EJC99630.1 alpha/beta-hydrolase [Fomitiporia mediterranea MF3/22]
MSFTRETVKIPSVDRGVNLDVWLYKPARPAPFPVIVAGPGLTVVKAAGFQPFGERWAEAGYASLILDFRFFGDSDGEPRNLAVIKKQVEDYRSVLQWARQHPELFNLDKIVVMGSASSGLVMATLAIEEPGLAGAMGHCPLMDGYATLMAGEPKPRLLFWAAVDWIRSKIGLSPLFIKCAGNPGELALLDTPSVAPGFEFMFAQSGKPFAEYPNTIAPRFSFDLLSSRPGAKLKDAKCPVLVVASKEDDMIPLAVTRKLVEQADGKVRLVEAPGTHFDILHGGKGFDVNINAQLAFLQSLL